MHYRQTYTHTQTQKHTDTTHIPTHTHTTHSAREHPSGNERTYHKGISYKLSWRRVDDELKKVFREPRITGWKSAIHKKNNLQKKRRRECVVSQRPMC